MHKIQELYDRLFREYGPQGWWPILGYKGINPTKSGSVKGYHPGDYSFPRDDDERFQICIGAILTQNTSWTNVEKALINLNKRDALSIKGFRKLSDPKLKELIKVSGYYNQKARKLKEFAEFYVKNKDPSREDLLSIWGIGEETADSILLYAFGKPSFVVDTYTKRFLLSLGLIDEKSKYAEIKSLFEDNLPKDVKVYQEYHALLVENGKRMLKKID